MNLLEVSEGQSRLLVPREEKLTRKNPVFYNPEMEINRDISVAAAKIINPETFCDALAASGARGVRIAKEVGCKVTANDVSPLAAELIRRNAELNSVSVRIEQKDANQLLSSERFDFVDLDPFGPPVGFIDSALRSVKGGGMLAVTATDTSALCGTYPRACRRKYDSVSLRTDYYNELGLRILIGYVARAGLKYDICAEPIFSHCTRHYFRTYLGIRRSSGGANKALKKMGYIRHCFSCMSREYASIEELSDTCSCGEKTKPAGPLWMAELADPIFCGELEKTLAAGSFGTKKEASKLAALVGQEQSVVLPYYDIHKFFGRMGMPAPPTEEIQRRLAEAGFSSVRTHFSGVGIRTEASAAEMRRIFKG